MVYSAVDGYSPTQRKEMRTHAETWRWLENMLRKQPQNTSRCVRFQPYEMLIIHNQKTEGNSSCQKMGVELEAWHAKYNRQYIKNDRHVYLKWQIKCHIKLFSIKYKSGAGEMAQELRPLAALEEYSGSVLSTHRGAYNSLWLQF